MSYLNLKNACKKIIAIGRNYADHAAELGNKVPTGNPIIFSKPSTSIITAGSLIQAPKGCQRLDHELELGVVIGKNCKNVREEDAMDHVVGYVLALDMTARDVQNELKKGALPWLLAKGFDTSCPIGEFIDRNKIKDVNNLSLKLSVNGATKQNGNTKEMIFKIPTLISFVSQSITLEEGDIILTGTPAGVGPVKPGDLLEGVLAENSNILSNIKFSVGANN